MSLNAPAVTTQHVAQQPVAAPVRWESLGLLDGQLINAQSLALKPTAQLIELIQPLRGR